MRWHIDINDGAVFLGVFLLIFSISGLYFESAASMAPESFYQVRGFYRPDKLISRVFASPQPTHPIPTLTAFADSHPTPAPGSNRAQELPTDKPGFLKPLIQPPTATPLPLPPDRIVIPAIDLDAPVVASGYELIDVDGGVYQLWDAPNEYAAGWLLSSAALGVPGNMVITGHHNIYGSVFGRLIDLAEGDSIQVYSGGSVSRYQVTNKMILPERGEDLSVRLDNARWLLASKDERLTLVTCWPQSSNTHRLILVAKPVRPDLGR